MTDHSDGDRRQLQRYQMKIPALIVATLPDRETTVELFTRDVCSGGAFFPTDSPLPAGANVRITLSWDAHEYSAKVNMTTDGRVIRSEGAGMAVAFSPRYQMSPVPA